ncbi:BrnT family toxin [Candidatus Uabimicrobium sp. HlEnr_7]|uniref:BrnT family toxin n=1 Tax=Candidatus Uabimicrobium helgolandensis TaxID=3095367 RepID=UPI0035589075
MTDLSHYNYQESSYVWYSDKAKKNHQKHKVSFEEAASVFHHPLAQTIADTLHSFNYERFITVGWSNKQRIIIVVYREWNDAINIISARRATSGERKSYQAGDDRAFLFNRG